MNFEDVPWSYILPALVLIGFGSGLVYKRLQDKTVEIVSRTLRPGELHVDDLTAYAAKTMGKTSKGTNLGY